MKKWLIVLLVSFSFLLFGCNKKESEVTTKKLIVKDFYSEEFVDATYPKISMKQKTIRNDVTISGVNQFVLVFLIVQFIILKRKNFWNLINHREKVFICINNICV